MKLSTLQFLVPAWNWLARIFRRQPPLYRALHTDDLPRAKDAHTVYLVGEKGHLWYAALLCPCGCGALLELNLISTTRPCWTVTIQNNNAVTLEPSVWRQKECRSHFWLRDGCVTWCGPI